MYILPRNQTKSVEGFMDMLTDLRALGDGITRDNQQSLLTRTVAFKPFCAAVGINITAFFTHAPAKQASKVIELTSSWFGGETEPYATYRNTLFKKTQQWMKAGKHHPDGLTFAAKHLLNVITLWPQPSSSIGRAFLFKPRPRTTR